MAMAINATTGGHAVVVILHARVVWQYLMPIEAKILTLQYVQMNRREKMILMMTTVIREIVTFVDTRV